MTVHGRRFAWGSRSYIMGIINLTPDSFSGDGVGADVAAAVELARRLEAEGADILDLGAESSRPSAPELDVREELRRLIPAFEAVRAATNLPISVDTYHVDTAKAVLAVGADMINDIWGFRHEKQHGSMAEAVISSKATVIAMHNQRGRAHTDVASDILRGWRETTAIAEQHGIPPDRLILDPGFGFGWRPAQNLEMLRRLPELWAAQLPILVGVSRKSTLGMVLDAPVEDRFEATAAAVAIAIAGGADIIRVHEVAAMVRVARVTDAIVRANWGSV